MRNNEALTRLHRKRKKKNGGIKLRELLVFVGIFSLALFALVACDAKPAQQEGTQEAQSEGQKEVSQPEEQAKDGLAEASAEAQREVEDASEVTATEDVTPEMTAESLPESSCQPKRCIDLGVECDNTDDGCGTAIFCGDCTAPLTCGGGGQPGRCGQPPEPVNCQPLTQRPRWELCASTPDRCEGVFNDGAGCQAFCQAAGLECLEVHEDLAGCRKDTSRPPLSCDTPTGHQSDWCACGRKANCVPNCQGRVCGLDGCGGSCGACGADQQCDAQGRCVNNPTGPQEDCTKYPFQSATLLAERVGFGRRATGGDPSRIYRVRNLNNSGTGSLRAGLESADPLWIVFDVEGEIRLQTRIEIRSNKTVDGRGKDIRILGGLRISQGVRNVILSDIAISNRTTDQDAIEVRGNTSDNPSNLSTRDFWFHHLELYNSSDGLLDVTHAATDMTVSWVHFHSHIKAVLIVSDSNFPNQDAAIRMTFHHNYFNKITRRGPQLRYGIVDYFNNYQREWYEVGAASLSNGQFLSENNIYEARPGTVCITRCPDPNPGSDANDFVVSKRAVVNDWANVGLGNIRSVGDIVEQGAQITTHNPQQVFQRSTHYQATPEPASAALKQRIMQLAGPPP